MTKGMTMKKQTRRMVRKYLVMTQQRGQSSSYWS